MYSADLKLGGAINVYKNTWVYPDGTIKLLEATANDPARDLVNWTPAPYVGSADRQCDTINLTWLKHNSPNPMLHHIYDQFHTVLGEHCKSYYNDYSINEKNNHSNSFHSF